MQRDSLATMIAALLIVATVALSTACADPLVLYVSQAGNNSWSGTLPEPNPGGTDGPLKTLKGARDKIRGIKFGPGLTQPIEVQMRGGIYYESATLELYYIDSGTADYPITYKAYPGEAPIISGGRVINNVAKVPGQNLYQATVPEAISRQWIFWQLFVDDERYTLARSPNQGYYFVAGIPPEPTGPYHGEPWWQCHNFYFHEDDLKNWSTLATDDILIQVFSLWEGQVVILDEVDEVENTAFSLTHVLWGYDPHEEISGGGISKRYIVHNAPDALDAAGEWYVDRQTGTLSIIPRGEEDLAAATIIAPVTEKAVIIDGDADAGQFVEYINIEGLTFKHYTAPPIAAAISDGWKSNQGATNIEACVSLDAAQHCSLRNCTVAHTGLTGIELSRGCQYNVIEQNHLYDLGGGGVNIGERLQTSKGYDPGTQGHTSHNQVVNNYIHDGGMLHTGGMGVIIGQASDNLVSHNEIGFFAQSGMQIGWNWDTADTWHERNTIEYNHVHDIGLNISSDLGGIYTVGINDDTVIRNNLIHDVWCYVEGSGKGIYPDQESHNITFENNIIYRVGSYGFGVNFASDLTVRNNIFALTYGKAPFMFGHRAYANITNNIFYYDYGNVYADNNNKIKTDWFVTCDQNLFWRIGGKPVTFQETTDDSDPAYGRLTLSEWQAETGKDLNSIIADPCFADPANGDFNFLPDSPYSQIGFVPIDASQIGLTGDPSWTSLPQQYERETFYVPFIENNLRNRFSADGVSDSFEYSLVGSAPKNAAILMDDPGNGAMVEVSDVRAAQGTQSLKVQANATALPAVLYDTYDPIVYAGTVRLTTEVYKEPGAALRLELISDNGGTPVTAATMDILPAGLNSTLNGQSIVAIPDEQWIKVQLTVGVDYAATEVCLVYVLDGDTVLYTGTAAIPGDLPDNLDQVKISALTAYNTFYLDNFGVQLFTWNQGSPVGDPIIDLYDFVAFQGSRQYDLDITRYPSPWFVSMPDFSSMAASWLQLSPTLVNSHWSLDQTSGATAPNLVAGGPEAQLIGAANWTGTSFLFDGNGYFHIPKTAPGYDMDFTQDFTVTTRIRTTQGGTGTIWSRLNSGWEPGCKQCSVKGGVIMFDCGWVGTILGDKIVNDGVWHDIEVQYDADNNEITILVDGIVDIQMVLPNDLTSRPDDYDMFMGVQQDLGGGERHAKFLGEITWLRIVN